MAKQDPALTAKILELYPIWQSIKKVSKLVHLSETAVYLTLKRHNVKMAKPGGWRLNESRLSHDAIRITAELYEGGYSTNEIAHMLSISHSTVSYRLRKAGVPLRPRGESVKRRWARKPKGQGQS